MHPQRPSKNHRALELHQPAIFEEHNHRPSRVGDPVFNQVSSPLIPTFSRVQSRLVHGNRLVRWAHYKLVTQRQRLRIPNIKHRTIHIQPEPSHNQPSQLLELPLLVHQTRHETVVKHQDLLKANTQRPAIHMSLARGHKHRFSHKLPHLSALGVQRPRACIPWASLSVTAIWYHGSRSPMIDWRHIVGG